MNTIFKSCFITIWRVKAATLVEVALSGAANHRGQAADLLRASAKLSRSHADILLCLIS